MQGCSAAIIARGITSRTIEDVRVSEQCLGGARLQGIWQTPHIMYLKTPKPLASFNHETCKPLQVQTNSTRLHSCKQHHIRTFRACCCRTTCTCIRCSRTCVLPTSLHRCYLWVINLALWPSHPVTVPVTGTSAMEQMRRALCDAASTGSAGCYHASQIMSWWWTLHLYAPTPHISLLLHPDTAAC